MGIKEKRIEDNSERGEISFSLNKDFYTLEEIKKALGDFEEICEGKILENQGKYVKIVLNSKEPSLLNELKNEFCNYSLGLMKNNLRV